MYVILPLCDVPSLEKTERILECLSKVAPDTFQNEPGCHAYAWFRNAEPTEAVPAQWLRGLEVYATPEDNQVKHRARQPYKDFRAAVAAEGLFNGYPDLRFWRPTGVGFLTRAPVNMMADPDTSQKEIIAMKQLSPKANAGSGVLDALKAVAQSVEEGHLEVGTFWVLQRDNIPQDGDDVFLVSRFPSRKSYETFLSSETGKGLRDLEGLCDGVQTTAWSGTGIGFLER